MKSTDHGMRFTEKALKLTVALHYLLRRNNKYIDDTYTVWGDAGIARSPTDECDCGFKVKSETVTYAKMERVNLVDWHRRGLMKPTFPKKLSAHASKADRKRAREQEDNEEADELEVEEEGSGWSTEESGNSGESSSEGSDTSDD